MVATSRKIKSTFANPIEREITELPKDDFKWCTVSLSDVLTAGKRLEAAVFDIDAKQAREAIENCKWDRIAMSDIISNAYYPGRFKRIYCTSNNGTPFFLPSQMTDIFPKPEKWISALTKCDVDDLRLKKHDLLLTRSGTVGKLTLVSKTLEGTVFSDDVIRVTLGENEVGYLYAYLTSTIGNMLLTTNRYGSVIQHIEPEHLDDIPLPNPPTEIKKHINDLILRSFELRDQSNELIDKATKMLVSALNLPPIDKIQTKRFDNSVDVDNFCVKLSDFDYRIDASYHIPLAEAITEILNQNAAEVTIVSDKRVSNDIILPGRFKRIYVEEGHGRVFFGGKQIFELDPSNKKFLSISKHSARIKAELEITENTLLITRSGSVGKVAITPKHWEHWIASDHIIRVCPNNEIAGYLSIFLSSEYGEILIKRFTYGSVVDEIDANHVSQIPFPFLKDKSIQNKINDLALEANKLRYEAYLLEQQAIKSIEEDVIFA